MMAKYVSYDSENPAPSPVNGWYDADTINYGAGFPAVNKLPAGGQLLEITTEQWAATRTNLNGWAVSNGALVPYP